MTVFASNLVKKREEKKMTQEELAKRTGVTQGAISQYERGIVPTAPIAVKIAEALGTTVEQLVKEKEV